MIMKKVVLDTNVLLVAISDRSKLHWVFESLINNAYMICVSTDILAEYAEIIGQKMGGLVSESVLATIENLPNVELITAYYHFGLLTDEDDNKFVDCAIAANASFIVSHDKDFDILKNIPFPTVNVIDTTFAKCFFKVRREKESPTNPKHFYEIAFQSSAGFLPTRRTLNNTHITF